MRRSLLLATAALLAACHSKLPTEPGSVLIGGALRARAESGPGIGPADGPAVAARVIVTNVSGHAATLNLSYCSVRLRIYREGATLPVYDDSGDACPLIYVPPVTIAAGRADTIARVVGIEQLTAAGGTPTGPYRVEVRLDAEGHRGASAYVLDAGTVTLGGGVR